MDHLRTSIVRWALLSVLAVGCGDEGHHKLSTVGCEDMEAEAIALLTEFGRCRTDAECAVMPLNDSLEHGSVKRCPRAFLCAVPVRVDARSALITRANTFVKTPSTCTVCPIANCVDLETLQGYCDAATSACRIRTKIRP